MKNISKIFFTILLLLAFKYSFSTPINLFIDTVNPQMNAVSVDRNSDITVSFTQSMNAVTLNNSNIKVFGYLSGLLTVTISYEQATKTLTINPNEEMKIGEEISVTLTDNIMTMGGQSITPFVYKFRVHVLGGNGMFVRSSGIAGFQSAILKSGDIDGDNDIDLVVNNKTYKNNGQAVFTFSEELSMPGIPELADFDSDGDLDILIQNGNNVFFYQNNGLGNFAQTYSFPGGVDNFGDLNGDGYLDISYFQTNSDIGFLQNSNGVFNFDSAYHFSGCTNNYKDVTLIDDFNNDGSLDVLAVHGSTWNIFWMFHLCRDYNMLLNDGEMLFSTSQIYNKEDEGGILIWDLRDSKSFDYDNDGYVDIVTPGFQLKNNGNTTFNHQPTNIFGSSTSVVSDFNGDGFIDLASSLIGTVNLYSNLNNTNSNFNQVLGNAHGFGDLSGADFDNDGDIDMAGFDLGAQEVSILINSDLPSPVELSNFNSTVNANNVTLTWTTSSENNNSGFDLERSESGSTTGGLNGWIKLGFIEGNGSSNAPVSYTFSDRNLSSGKYKYRLKQTDFNGNLEYHDLSGEVIIGIPVKSGLAQNYPNPFNPVTKLGFGISDLGFASMKVYNSLGKEVMTLVNENKEAGYYQTTFDGSSLPSGMYFYRLSVDGNVVDTKRMALVK